MRRNLSILFCLLALTAQAPAQLSQNPNKFLGNITTYGSVNPSGFEYKSLWNQITCENETKWSSVQGNRSYYNWGGADNAYNYAKNNNILFKFHTLVWGSQYPESWFNSSLPVSERYNAIVAWMDEAHRHYPNLEMIDVVNEAVGTHQAGNPLMKESLGGGGKTGYDWLIKAFELAYERWPNAILIYNDFNTFQWDTDAYIELVRTLRDAGAPIDAYGCQSHDVNDISASTLQSTMTRIQNELKLPMYITELDINLSDDNKQKTQLQNIFPMMWEADYCAGVTLWGYVYGATWVDYSGLYKSGSPRPAMTWLIDYMKTDTAKNAKSPFPGKKKEASLYIKPGASYLNTPMNMNIRASLRTKTIEKIEVYVDNTLSTTLTEAPFISNYVPKTLGKHQVKAILYTTDGNKYERIANFTTGGERSPFKEMSLPGTIEAEDFDISGEGTSYHDNESTNRGGASYRTDGAGVDVTSIGTGQYAVCNTTSGEWIEYTVNITESGTYSYDAYVSSKDGGALNISLTTDGTYKSLVDLTIPQTTTDNTNVFKAVHGRLTLEEGKQIIMLTISSGDYKIDKIVFNRVDIDNDLKTTVTASPARALAKNPVTLTATTSPETTAIKSVRFYVNNVFMDEKTEAPYEIEYTPAQYGSYIISAIAVGTDDKQSAIGSTTLKARQTYQAKRVSIPGTIEAEKFDKGGEGFTFHDSDSKNDGTTSFRQDSEGVDIYSGNNGYAVGNTKANEWLEYSVNVKEAGTYSIAITASAASKNTSFKLETIDDAGTKKDLGTFTVPSTGNVSTYSTSAAKNLTKPLEAGYQTFRITVKTAGFYLDKIKFNLVQSGVSYIMEDDQWLNGTRYNLGGVRVDQFNKNGITIINGKKVLIVE